MNWPNSHLTAWRSAEFEDVRLSGTHINFCWYFSALSKGKHNMFANIASATKDQKASHTSIFIHPYFSCRPGTRLQPALLPQHLSSHNDINNSFASGKTDISMVLEVC